MHQVKQMVIVEYTLSKKKKKERDRKQSNKRGRTKKGHLNLKKKHPPGKKNLHEHADGAADTRHPVDKRD